MKDGTYVATGYICSQLRDLCWFFFFKCALRHVSNFLREFAS